LLIPLYTHFLSPSDYGLLEIFDLFVMVTTMILGMGFNASLVRFYKHYEDEADRKQVVATALTGTLTICVVAFFFLQAASHQLAVAVMGDATYESFFQIVLCTLLFQNVLNIPDNLLLAQKRAKTYSMVSLSGFLLGMTLNILLVAVFQYGIFGILISNLASRALITVVLLYVTRDWVKLAFSWEKLKQLAAFGAPLVPAAFAMLSMHFADRLFLQRYADPAELGLYALGYKFGMIISLLVTQPLTNVWGTVQYEIAAASDAAGNIGRMYTYMAGVLLFAGLGISVFVADVIHIMAPAEYALAGDIAPFIVLSYVIYSFANIAASGMYIRNRTQGIAKINIVVAVANLGLNFLLVPMLGMWGAALTTIATFTLLLGLNVHLAQQAFPVRFEIRRLAMLVVMALGVYLVSRFIDGPLLLRLVLKLGLCGVTLPLLWNLGFFSAKEMDAVRQHIAGLQPGLLWAGLRQRLMPSAAPSSEG
jgi:O-antigen/teichoic acid export membrane protein